MQVVLLLALLPRPLVVIFFFQVPDRRPPVLLKILLVFWSRRQWGSVSEWAAEVAGGAPPVLGPGFSPASTALGIAAEPPKGWCQRWAEAPPRWRDRGTDSLMASRARQMGQAGREGSEVCGRVTAQVAGWGGGGRRRRTEAGSLEGGEAQGLD